MKIFKVQEFDQKHPDGSYVVLEGFGGGCRLRIRDYRDEIIKDLFFEKDGKFSGSGTEFLRGRRESED